MAKTDAPLETLAELGGYGAAFSPDGARLAYLKLDVTAEMRELEKSIETADTAERTQAHGKAVGPDRHGGADHDSRSDGEHRARGRAGAIRKSAVRLAGDGVVRVHRQRERRRRADLRRPGRRRSRGGNHRRDRRSAAGRQCAGHRRALHAPRAGPPRRRRRRRRRGSACWRCRREPRRSSPDRRRRSPPTAAAGVRDARRAELAAARRAGGQSRSRHRRPHRPRTPRRAGALARRQPRRVPDDDERRLGALHGQGRRHGRTAPDARDPARSAAAVPRRRSPARPDRRAAAPPLVPLRPRLRQRGRGCSTTTPCARSRRSTTGSRAPTARRC